ncbi:MAG: hypothetical protein JO353_07175 [Phycisphaerae bacterium]|nr:hypothetical protein [Phycisphaerae bacterium]
MRDRAAKKHKRELQRREKVRHARRDADHPWKRIKLGNGQLQVWITKNWHATRQCSILALRSVGGSQILGAYLIDQGVSGLKDAWSDFNASMDAVNHHIETMSSAGIEMVQTSPEEALRLIRGAVRFAHDNGFRLPKKYERTISILGDLGDWRNADVSDFSMEFAGSLDDLRRRLVSQPVDEFLARRDINIILDETTPSLLRDEEFFDELESMSDEEADALSAEVQQTMIDDIRQRCVAKGESPEPMLKQGLEVVMSVLARQLEKGNPSTDEDSGMDSPEAEMEFEDAILATTHSEAELASLKSAIAQIIRVGPMRDEE